MPGLKQSSGPATASAAAGTHPRKCSVPTSRLRTAAEPAWAVQMALTPSERAAALEAFGRDPEFQPPPSFRVVALLAGFNENDVLGSSLRHNLCQGVGVHFLDNWSTDGSAETVAALQRELGAGTLRCDGAGGGRVGPPLSGVELTYELFPPEAPTGTFDWALILERKAELSNRGRGQVGAADWVLHADPDELRESPWGPSISLRQALYVAHRLGYNKASFDKLFVFRPVHTGAVFPEEGGDLRSAFEHFDLRGLEVDRSTQVKAWRRRFPAPTFVGLWAEADPVVPPIKLQGGGHVALHLTPRLENRIFPWSFVLRHYPIRSQRHGERKVFRERRARWNRREREFGWHKQYDAVSDSDSQVFVLDASTLKRAPLGDIPPLAFEAEFPCHAVAAKRGGGGSAPTLRAWHAPPRLLLSAGGGQAALLLCVAVLALLGVCVVGAAPLLRCGSVRRRWLSQCTKSRHSS